MPCYGGGGGGNQPDPSGYNGGSGGGGSDGRGGGVGVFQDHLLLCPRTGIFWGFWRTHIWWWRWCLACLWHNGSGSDAGDGGAGLPYSITGITTHYAGGGGGGRSGAGGTNWIKCRW